MVIKSNFTQSSGSIGVFFQILTWLESIILAGIFFKKKIQGTMYLSKNCKSPFRSWKCPLFFSKVIYVWLNHTTTNKSHTAPWKLFLMQKQRERNQMSSLDKLRQSPNFYNHQTRAQTQCGKWGRGKQINDPRIELYPLSLSSGRIQGHKRAYGTIFIKVSGRWTQWDPCYI